MRRKQAMPEATLEPPSSQPFSPLVLQHWQQFRPTALARNEGVQINVFDVIGDRWSEQPVTAGSIKAALDQAGGADVTVNINSPGGSAFEGLAIYNLLRQYSGQVVVNVLGLAASAASVIAMAGDEIRIGKAAMMMIHNSSGLCWGTAQDMRDMAAVMDKLDSLMVGIYSARTGTPEADIAALMHQTDHYMTGQEAVDAGYADSLLATDAPAATESTAVAALMPMRIAAMAHTQPPNPPPAQSEETDMDLQAAQARIAELEAQNKALAQQHRESRITALAQKVSLTDEQKQALAKIEDATAFDVAVSTIEACTANTTKAPPLPQAMQGDLRGQEPTGNTLDDKFNAFMKGA